MVDGTGIKLRRHPVPWILQSQHVCGFQAYNTRQNTDMLHRTGVKLAGHPSWSLSLSLATIHVMFPSCSTSSTQTGNCFASDPTPPRFLFSPAGAVGKKTNDASTERCHSDPTPYHHMELLKPQIPTTINLMGSTEQGLTD